MKSSQSVTQAFAQFGPRQLQLTLNGRVESVQANGALVVTLGGTAVTAMALIDHRFQAGESVLLARVDDGAWEVLGSGSVEGGDPPAGLPPVPPPEPSKTGHSQSLREAIGRLLGKQSTLLLRGYVQAVLDDGTLHVQLKQGTVAARSASTQLYTAGLKVSAVKLDSGQFVVLGAPVV
jgi:hypothetical protein